MKLYSRSLRNSIDASELVIKSPQVCVMSPDHSIYVSLFDKLNVCNGPCLLNLKGQVQQLGASLPTNSGNVKRTFLLVDPKGCSVPVLAVGDNAEENRLLENTCVFIFGCQIGKSTMGQKSSILCYDDTWIHCVPGVSVPTRISTEIEFGR